MKPLLLLLAASALLAAPPSTDIKVDQAGYLPKLPKLAFVVTAQPGDKFVVRRAADSKSVFEGTLAAPADDPLSGDTVRAADFSKLTQPGDYFLEVPGVGVSYKFSIGEKVYSRAWYLAMRSYYGQRCGIAVDLGPEFPGYKYEACHTEGAYHESTGKSGRAPSSKGWHDAGDYGRYIVNSGISTGTLLWTYELYTKRVGAVKLNLPESGNKTPDILNEIRWNLDWMLTLQDTDGGVFHKQTTAQFCGFVMPEKDKAPSLIIGTGPDSYKGTCATADFASVMAIAARVYKPFDAAFSTRALEAARKAYAYAEAHPNVLFRNPKDVNTGGYGDGNCSDELLWAAAELFRTTREPAFDKAFRDKAPGFFRQLRPTNPPAWASVGALGLWTYALAGVQNETATQIRQAALEAADALVQRTRNDPYRISMTKADYIWGSNSVVANYGVQLLVANALKPNPAYVETAVENLHYLLGRNTLSLSYVTQVGANPFRHPHHRPSGADGLNEPWPGLLSGGPNARRQDPAMAKLPANGPPAKSFLDEEASYATNEIAINWNAPLVFLLAATLPESK